MTIANGVVTALRDARILLPSISTIERASIAGRARARKQAAYALIAALSVEQVHTPDRLFDDADGMSQLASLKTIHIAAKPEHTRKIPDRQNGRAACRERVCQYGSSWGGAVYVKKNRNYNKALIHEQQNN